MSFKSSTLLLLSAAGLASADLSDPDQFVYLNESATDLAAAGFADLTAGSPLLVESTADNGGCLRCYTFETLATTSNKGFIEVTIEAGPGFLEDGAFVVMNLNFPSGFGGGIGQDDFINLVNTQGGGGQITAATPENSGNSYSSFSDWLNEDFEDSTVFNFDPQPFAPGGSVSFTFAWDFTEFSGLTVDGLGTTPAPGALALLGLAGLGRRRRQK